MTEHDLERLAAAGIYGPADDDAAEQLDVLESLVAHGVSVDELVATPRLGGLVLRAFDQLIQPGERLTLDEVAASSRVPAADVLRLRRAWGQADPVPGERCFVPADIGVLGFFQNIAGLVGPERTVDAARGLGTAMSRLAEAEIALIRSQLEGQVEARSASIASILLRYRLVLQTVLPAVMHTLDALHRAHLVDIGRRYTHGALPASEHNLVDLVIGFADLTGSTTLVRQLDVAGLDRALTTFEDVSTDVIVAAGAMVVKRLGDGVMFVTAQADVACALALRLVDVFRDHPAAPPVRVGLAAGHVAALRGDFYGPAVHLAARIVTASPPATALVSPEVRERAPAVVCRSVGPQALAGFPDPIELFALVS